MPWYWVCDVMSWYRVCDVMPWYRVCDVMPWFMISGMWCHAMISGMWWCHVHHDIGYVMMSCPCYWHYGMLCRHITSSCNDSLKSKAPEVDERYSEGAPVPLYSQTVWWCQYIWCHAWYRSNMMSCHDIVAIWWHAMISYVISCHDNILCVSCHDNGIGITRQ